MNLSLPAKAALALLSLLAFACPRAWADGGVVLASREVDGMKVTVFASPFPLRAGPNDISVLAQKDGETLLDPEISMRWTSMGSGEEWLPPCCSMAGGDGAVRAGRNHSQNKLLHSAILPIKSSGPGKLDLSLQRGDTVSTLSLDLTASPAPAPVLAYWPWLAMTPLAILGFALRQRIARRERTPGVRPASAEGLSGRA